MKMTPRPLRNCVILFYLGSNCIEIPKGRYIYIYMNRKKSHFLPENPPSFPSVFFLKANFMANLYNRIIIPKLHLIQFSC